MICERVLYNGLNQKYTLESLMIKYLGYVSVKSSDLFSDVDDSFNYEKELGEEFDELDSLDFKEVLYIDKSIRTQFVELGDKPFTKSQIEYGANDIITPIQIKAIQEKGRYITAEDHYLPRRGFALENATVVNLAKMELRGIKVDVQGWLALYQKNLSVYKEKKERLEAWVLRNFPKYVSSPDLFGQVSCTIDWKSPKEVIKFARDLDICPKEVSKSTGRLDYTVGAKAMFKLLNNTNKDLFYAGTELPMEALGADAKQEFILNFLLLKKAQQLSTTFGKEWLRFIHPITGRVHYSFIQLMNTGRMSCVNPNIQQIPNGKEWRALFVPEKGNSMIATDFSAKRKYRTLTDKNAELISMCNFEYEIYSRTRTVNYQTAC
jgi:hypothetical protein